MDEYEVNFQIKLRILLLGSVKLGKLWVIFTKLQIEILPTTLGVVMESPEEIVVHKILIRMVIDMVTDEVHHLLQVLEGEEGSHKFMISLLIILFVPINRTCQLMSICQE